MFKKMLISFKEYFLQNNLVLPSWWDNCVSQFHQVSISAEVRCHNPRVRIQRKTSSTGFDHVACLGFYITGSRCFHPKWLRTEEMQSSHRNIVNDKESAVNMESAVFPHATYTFALISVQLVTVRCNICYRAPVLK